MFKVLEKSIFVIGLWTITVRHSLQALSKLALATVFALPLILFAQVALAAVPVVNTTILLEKTGSEPFDAVSWTGDGPGGAAGGTNAGMDADENDNIVRLQDSITYRVEVSVNDSDVDDLTATVIANEKQKWIIIPTGCKTDPGDVGAAGVSEIRDSGAELFCNMGPAIEGTTRIFFPAARVVGVDPRDPSLVTRNDDIVTASVTAQANPGGANPSNIAMDTPTSAVVTGFFRVDLQKGLKVTALDPDTMQPLYVAPAKDGAAPGNRPGSLIEYTIKAVYAKGSLIANGADEAAGDFTADYSIVDVYTDDNDNNNLGGLSTGGILYDWDPSTPACELLGDHGVSATVSCSQLIAAIDDVGAGAGPPDGINDAAIQIDLTDIDVSDPDADGNLFEIRLNIWFDRDNEIRTHQDCVGTDCTVFVTNRIGLWDGVGTVLSAFDEDNDPNIVSTEDASMNNIDNYNDAIEPFPNEISYPLEFRLPGGYAVHKAFTDIFPFATDKAPDQSMAAGETRPFLLNVYDYRKIDQGESQVCDKIDTQVYEYAGVAPPNQIGSPALYSWNQNRPFNPVMSTFGGAVGTTLGDGSALVDFYFTNILYTADPIADQAGYISELRTATCEDDVSGDGNVVIVNEAGNTVDENGDPTVITEIDWWVDANMVPPVGGGAGSPANVTRLRQDSIYDAAAALAQDPTHARFAIAVNHLITAKLIATSPYGANNRLPNFASTRRDEGDENFTAWLHGPISTEDPAADATFSIASGLVDRMTLVPSSHSIEKYTDPRGIKVVRGGDNIDFIIEPKVFGLWNDLVDNTANIDDNLPNGTSYVANSEMFSPDGGASWYSRADWDARFIAGLEDVSVDSAAHVAGADPLNWDFGSLNSSVLGSDQLPLIKYTVFVDPARVSGTFINIAEIDSAAIGGGIKQARYQLTILPDFGLDVLKTVDQPIHQVNSPFSFNLVYKNLGGDDFTTGEFIDILPYNGDADPGVTTGGINSNRDPESDYNGIYDISAVSRSNGETFFVTIADPTTIEEDPCHASNLPLGFDPSIPSGVCSLYYAREGTLPGGGAVGTNSSNWVQCTTLDPLICGALDNTDITAIKFTAPSLLAAEGGQTVTIEFEPVGNLGGTPDLDSEGKVTAASTGDIYTNTFGGRVSEISLNVISNDVSVTLVSGSIGDTVWFDLDADGNGPTGAGDESDVTEPPIVGAQVVLLDASGDPVLIDPDTGAVVTAVYVNPLSGNPAIPYIAITDNNGQYQFDNLPAGTYSVEVTPPLGATATFDADGISTPNISTHDLTPVTDAAGQLIGVEDNVDQDFGYIPPLQVGSTVWLDINNDGTQASDGSEPGIAGVAVQLFREGDDPLTATPVATAISDGNGDYIMNTGSAGNYFIYIPVPPAGATLSSSDIGSSGSDNGIDADDNGLQVSAGDSVQSPVFNLNYGTEPTGVAENGLTGGAQDDALDNNGDMTIDFGFYPTGSIGDLVMIDIDGDGVLDPGDGDAGIGGVTVTLQYTDLDGQSVTLTTITALNGSYLFDNLPGNLTYTITVDTTTLPGTLGDDIRASYDADGGLDSTSQTTLNIVANQVVDDLDQDFGYVPLGTVGDTIWYDSNNDGVQDAGELGIGGVTVQLTPPPLVDLGNGPGVPITTVTDPGGTYLFDNLPIGDYQVDVISGLNPAYQQTGDPDASLDNHSEVTLALNPSDSTEVIDNLDQDFGYSEPVSVGGYVWEDLNMDGLQDSDEPAIAGSTVTLLVDDGTGNFVPASHFDGGVVADITVGQNGQYLFDNLPEGDYKIQISKPDGTLPSPVQQTADDDDTPNDSNIASEPTPDVFESGVFMLRAGLEPVESNVQPGDDQDDATSAIARDESGNMTVDFGFVSPASIGNRVWLDFDGDGVQDANEDGIAGVTVVLTPPAGIDLGNGPGVPIETITGSDGEYLFPNLPPADGYVVTIPTPPANLTSTFDEDGDNNNDSGPISLLPGEEHLTADFGYAPPAGSIGDTIWIDANGDGVHDPGELGIPGVTVNLLDENGNILQTLVTDEQGKYLFTDLPEGIYGVEVDFSTLPLGYTAHPNGDPDVRDGVTTEADNVTTVQLETLPDGSVESNLDADFGYLPPPDQNNSIGDYVWLDTNADGVQDSDENPIPGVTLTLLNAAGEPVASTTTDENGQYLFTGVPDGSYTVVVTDAENILEGLEPTFDGDGLATLNQSTVTDLGVGVDTPVDELDQDFGYTPINNTPPANTGVIGDTIYFDVDGDGSQGGSEGGIEGVTVELRDEDGNLIAVMTTDENGNYLFTGLEVSGPGVNYTVTVLPDTLPGGGANWINSGDPDGGFDSTSELSLTTAAPVDLDQDFGYGGGINSLSGTIWPDANGDGVQDESETLAGVTVVLLDPDTGNIIGRAITDSNGHYEFTNLPDGRYTVMVTDDDNLLAGYEHTDGTEGEDQNSQADNGTYVVDLDSAGANDSPVHDVTSDFGYKPTLTTPITLGSFESEALSAGEVKFSWTTQSEVANAGFMIYQKVGDDWVTVNEDIIPAVGESLATVSYSYTAHQVESSEFVLVDVDTRGKQALHGPFALGERFGAVDKPTRLKSSRSALRRQLESRADVRKGAAKRSFKTRLDSYLGR